MESWVPLIEIFLNSPCPESEASLWLQKNFNPSSNTTSISTTSFLSLLIRPSDTNSIDASPPEKRVMWIETLPHIVQTRILSFLAYDHQRFCKRDLCRLARIMLSENKGLDFWVKKAAQQLLDLVSMSNYQWLSHLNLDSEEENSEKEFYLMPDWLRDVAKDSEPMFPWLPMLPDNLSENMPLSASGGGEDDFAVDVEENKQEEFDEMVLEVDVNELNFNNDPIDTEVEKMAKSLKFRLKNVESTSEAFELAKEIRELCFQNKRNSLVVLNLIELWSADDETAAVLLSKFPDGSEGDDLDWPTYILCSIFLPKFLVLKEPSSRVLMNATIEYCKAHQRAVEYALLFPLILRNEGINNPICDVITRIVKESLHPAHVSAFCQKLLCEDRDTRRFICLPCHQSLVSEELVWTESLFGLWQNILNHNVTLMQDSVDQLVRRVCEFAKRYSKSLKFGNFVLCLVNKCGPFLNPHKLLLTAAVENTESLVTKSILSKLSGL